MFTDCRGHHVNSYTTLNVSNEAIEHVYYIPTYLYMLNFPLPSISLAGFAHTRSFQDGDQKHG